MSKTQDNPKRSMWTGPKRRARGLEKLPPRPDGGPRSEPKGLPAVRRWGARNGPL